MERENIIVIVSLPSKVVFLNSSTTTFSNELAVYYIVCVTIKITTFELFGLLFNEKPENSSSLLTLIN